jgi:RimJ/RimL family protein N-acetyltransferase
MGEPACPEVIATERLELRPWTFEDLPATLDYSLDGQWGRFLPVPAPYHDVDARRFIAAQILLDRRQHASWSIHHQGRSIGGINIRFFHDHRIAELGYSIGRPWWGHGFATEAVRALVSAAFETYGRLARVRAMADARNAASLRVMEKAGFTREGLLRQNRVNRDELFDEVWCGLLRAEWEAQRAR